MEGSDAAGVTGRDEGEGLRGPCTLRTGGCNDEARERPDVSSFSDALVGVVEVGLGGSEDLECRSSSMGILGSSRFRDTVEAWEAREA